MEAETQATRIPKSGTRERILEAAFSFYRDYVFENVSLSKIASRVGISKAAIFKHFKTKDALIEAMDERAFSHLAAVLQETQALFREGKRRDALVRIISHLAGNREETFYLVSTVPRLTVDAIIIQLRGRGVSLFDNIFEQDGTLKDENLYYITVFTASTFLCFLMFWFSSEEASPAGSGESIAAFTEKFNRLIQDGLGCLEDIVDFEALESRCDEGMAAVKPLNRAFTALVAVIERNGIPGVTVEAIAGELGLAKSSLYSSFKSKEDMMRKLIEEELTNLYGSVLCNVRAFSSCGERVYILMRTSLCYFLDRPGIISIFQSLVLSGRSHVLGEKLHAGRSDFCQPLEEIVKLDFVPSLPDVGISGFDRKMLLAWLFSLPTMLYMHCRIHRLGRNEMLCVVRRLYGFLNAGINGWK